MPHGVGLNSESEKNILHALETSVIDWNHQIQEVLKSDSAAPLHAGLNPGPLVEIDFWTAKASNLSSIHQQLTSPKIQKISKVLETCKSTYFPAFQTVFEEVVAALKEANDISLYLKALRPQVEKLAAVNDFSELTNIFPGLMKTILMIWKASQHYNTPARLTVIIQEICNDLIEAARIFLTPAELFVSEPDIASAKLGLVKQVCEIFKNTFYEYKSMTHDTIRPWNIDTKQAFGRLDETVARVAQISDLFDIIIEFNRLEKIEIGGTKGNFLSTQVAQIFAEFTSGMSLIARIKYDVLDLSSNQFDCDRSAFLDKITDLDRRIRYLLVKV